MLAWPRPKPLSAVVVGGGLLAAALLAFAGAQGSIVVLVAFLALAVAALVLADWTAGVPLLLFVGSIDGFLKHYSASPATFILKDALFGLILVGLAIWLAVDRTHRPDNVRWRGAIAWFCYVGFMFSQLVHPAAGLAGAVGAFRAHAMFAALFVVGAIYFRQRERLGRTANLVIGLCSMIALAAIAQHAMGDRWLALSPGFMKASLHYTTFASQAARADGATGDAVYRMYGTLVDPASLGVASTYGILFAIAGMARLRGVARILCIAAIPLMGTALLLSQARAAMGGLAIGIAVLVVLLFTRSRTRGFAIAGVLLIAAAIPLGLILTHGAVADRVLQSDQVAYAQATRDYSQTIVLNALLTNPFGHGLAATGAGGGLRPDTGLAVDNVFFANLYETGFLGLAMFLLVQFTFMYLGLRAALRAKDIASQTAFAGIVAAQVALFVSCWFSQGGFDYAPVGLCFWLFTGAVARQDAWA
jgi:cell division protein FtsW (lipid II flippase)